SGVGLNELLAASNVTNGFNDTSGADIDRPADFVCVVRDGANVVTKPRERTEKIVEPIGTSSVHAPRIAFYVSFQYLVRWRQLKLYLQALSLQFSLRPGNGDWNND